MHDDTESRHAAVVAELVTVPSRVFVLGGVDTGKTTFSRRLARAAVEAGHVAAVVDADVGQSTIGPPSTVGMKIYRSPDDLPSTSPDGLSFVGSDSPRGHFLPLVVGTARLVTRAAELGAGMIIVDTTGFIAGVAGQRLKLAKAELIRPQHVVGLEQGSELEPVVGVLHRFVGAGVIRLPIHPDIVMRSVDERSAYREHGFAAALGPQVNRWRVRPTVFLPALPPGLELERLEGMLVGIDDGTGECIGIGVLEYHDDGLRLLTPVSEGVKALRLGSLRLEPSGVLRERVDVQMLLGSG